MLSEIDVLLGLSMEAKETNNNDAAIIEKARWLNKDVTAVLRKNIILPIMQASSPNSVLDIKCKDFFNRQRMHRGIR